MAGYQVLTPSAGSTDWTSADTQREKQRKGFLSMSLSNWDSTGVPAINAGSIVEMGGSLFQFTSTEAIGGTFTTSNPNYIYLTSSSSSLTASATSTAPTWSIAKQGYYDAGGTKRCVGGCEDDRDGKWIYEHRIKYPEAINEQGSGAHEMKCKVIDIGDWDMDTSSIRNIAHGLGDNWKKIRMCCVTIRNDDDDTYHSGPTHPDAGGSNEELGIQKIDSTNIVVNREGAGAFDGSTDYDATSYNRGWITIWYEV